MENLLKYELLGGYTKNILNDNCNYRNAQIQNSQTMLKNLCCDTRLNYYKNVNLKNKNSNSNVEGFTNGGFSGNLSGEYYLKPGECPVGHTKDEKGCRQICTHCTYSDSEPQSRSMNEYDICGPDGRYQGFNYYGYTVCLNKKDNKIYYPVDTYAKNAVLITDNPLHLNDYF